MDIEIPYHKKYYQTHKDVWVVFNKKYYEDHKQERKEYLVQYRQKNKNELKEKNKKYSGEYYKNNYKEKRIQRVLKYREQWLEIIKQKGMGFCSKCGYDKCFEALDFHHVNPEEKEFNIGRLLILIPTEERIKELDKCTCLCSNCHRELHAKNRKGGENVKEARVPEIVC